MLTKDIKLVFTCTRVLDLHFDLIVLFRESYTVVDIMIIVVEIGRSSL